MFLNLKLLSCYYSIYYNISINMIIRLFYSKKCPECMNLIQVIYNEGIVLMFTLVCLDNYSSKQIASYSIKQVPAIVINAENQLPAIYEGPVRCSQWLTNFTSNRRRNLAQQVELNRRLVQKTHANIRTQEGGPIEYTDAEMDGVSDGYSYNNTDLYQPKNFVMVGNEENCFIRTPQLVEGKVDIETMRRQMTDLESNRQNDNQQFMKIMEQNQIKAVVNYNANY